MEYTCTLSVRITERERKTLDTICKMHHIKSYTEFFRQQIKKEYVKLFQEQNEKSQQ